MTLATAMPRRTLGGTGISVSQLGFGGAVVGIPQYLSPGDRDSSAFTDQAERALARALDLGVTLFDTAPGYGNGRSESLYGAVLSGAREDIVLSTKLHMRPGEGPLEWEASLSGSLERLRTGHVDVLQVHGSTWSGGQADWLLGEPAAWLRRVRADGRARAVGVTAETPSGGLEKLVESGTFDTLQVAYNAIYQGACDYQRAPFGVIPLAKARGMGVLSMRTATSGVLARLLRAEFPDLPVDRINRLAVKFVLSTPEVDCALVGMAGVDEVSANCALAADTGDRLDLTELHNRFLT
ncbi:MAG TPA: aldo/keto reductase [Amycolatopsis sp.]|nr:aldo/keto reductase [Amycolatopsis sp.]